MIASGARCTFDAITIKHNQDEQIAICDNLWTVECFRKNEKIWETVWHNLVTVEGRNYLLNAGFKNGTLHTSWFITLFEDDYTPTASDTYAVPGFNETVAYDEPNRVAWQSGSVAAAEVSNTANKASFTFNATKNIYGGSLVSFATKDDIAQAGAVMYAAGRFDDTKPVSSGDIVKITTKVGLVIT